jgi:methionine-rich copper-binding protein CopC
MGSGTVDLSPLRNVLLAAASLAMLLLLSPVLASAVAAQEAVARAEPPVGAVLDRPPSRVELWLEKPPSAPGDVEVRVIHDQSGQRVDLGREAWDASDPGHLEVPLGPDLGPGKYVVSWVVAEDGREYSGTYSFTVGASADEGNDNLVTMALATFGAAGAAVVLGLAAYLVRVRLGLVKAPPGEGDSTR